jgi:hypothetical protein
VKIDRDLGLTINYECATLFHASPSLRGDGMLKKDMERVFI